MPGDETYKVLLAKLRLDTSEYKQAIRELESLQQEQVREQQQQRTEGRQALADQKRALNTLGTEYDALRKKAAELARTNKSPSVTAAEQTALKQQSAELNRQLAQVRQRLSEERQVTAEIRKQLAEHKAHVASMQRPVRVPTSTAARGALAADQRTLAAEQIKQQTAEIRRQTSQLEKQLAQVRLQISAARQRLESERQITVEFRRQLELIKAVHHAQSSALPVAVPTTPTAGAVTRTPLAEEAGAALIGEKLGEAVKQAIPPSTPAATEIGTVVKPTEPPGAKEIPIAPPTSISRAVPVQIAQPPVQPKPSPVKVVETVAPAKSAPVHLQKPPVQKAQPVIVTKPITEAAPRIAAPATGATEIRKPVIPRPEIPKVVIRPIVEKPVIPKPAIPKVVIKPVIEKPVMPTLAVPRPVIRPVIERPPWPALRVPKPVIKPRIEVPPFPALHVPKPIIKPVIKRPTFPAIHVPLVTVKTRVARPVVPAPHLPHMVLHPRVEMPKVIIPAHRIVAKIEVPRTIKAPPVIIRAKVEVPKIKIPAVKIPKATVPPVTIHAKVEAVKIPPVAVTPPLIKPVVDRKSLAAALAASTRLKAMLEGETGTRKEQANLIRQQLELITRQVKEERQVGSTLRAQTEELRKQLKLMQEQARASHAAASASVRSHVAHKSAKVTIHHAVDETPAAIRKATAQLREQVTASEKQIAALKNQLSAIRHKQQAEQKVTQELDRQLAASKLLVARKQAEAAAIRTQTAELQKQTAEARRAKAAAIPTPSVRTAVTRPRPSPIVAKPTGPTPDERRLITQQVMTEKSAARSAFAQQRAQLTTQLEQSRDLYNDRKLNNVEYVSQTRTLNDQLYQSEIAMVERVTEAQKRSIATIKNDAIRAEKEKQLAQKHTADLARAEEQSKLRLASYKPTRGVMPGQMVGSPRVAVPIPITTEAAPQKARVGTANEVRQYVADTWSIVDANIARTKAAHEQATEAEKAGAQAVVTAEASKRAALEETARAAEVTAKMEALGAPKTTGAEAATAAEKTSAEVTKAAEAEKQAAVEKTAQVATGAAAKTKTALAETFAKPSQEAQKFVAGMENVYAILEHLRGSTAEMQAQLQEEIDKLDEYRQALVRSLHATTEPSSQQLLRTHIQQITDQIVRLRQEFVNIGGGTSTGIAEASKTAMLEAEKTAGRSRIEINKEYETWKRLYASREITLQQFTEHAQALQQKLYATEKELLEARYEAERKAIGATTTDFVAAEKERQAELKKEIELAKMATRVERSFPVPTAEEGGGRGRGGTRSLYGSPLGRALLYSSYGGGGGMLGGAIAGIGTLAGGVFAGQMLYYGFRAVDMHIRNLMQTMRELSQVAGQQAVEFNTLQQMMGVSTDKVRDFTANMRKATLGVMDPTELYRLSIVAMRSPLHMTTAQIIALTQAAVKLSYSLQGPAGIQRAFSGLQMTFETGRAYTLARAIGMPVTPRMLGIPSIRGEAPQAHQIRQSEVVIKKIIEQASKLGPSLLTVSLAMEAERLASRNAKEAILQLVETSPQIIGFYNALTNVWMKLYNAVLTHKKEVAQAIDALGTLFLEFASTLAQVGKYLIPIFGEYISWIARTGEAWHKVTAFFDEQKLHNAQRQLFAAQVAAKTPGLSPAMHAEAQRQVIVLTGQVAGLQYKTKEETALASASAKSASVMEQSTIKLGELSGQFARELQGVEFAGRKTGEGVTGRQLQEKPPLNVQLMQQEAEMRNRLAQTQFRGEQIAQQKSLDLQVAAVEHAHQAEGMSDQAYAQTKAELYQKMLDNSTAAAMHEYQASVKMIDQKTEVEALKELERQQAHQTFLNALLNADATYQKQVQALGYQTTANERAREKQALDFAHQHAQDALQTAKQTADERYQAGQLSLDQQHAADINYYATAIREAAQYAAQSAAIGGLSDNQKFALEKQTQEKISQLHRQALQSEATYARARVALAAQVAQAGVTYALQQSQRIQTQGLTPSAGPLAKQQALGISYEEQIEAQRQLIAVYDQQMATMEQAVLAQRGQAGTWTSMSNEERLSLDLSSQALLRQRQRLDAANIQLEKFKDRLEGLEGPSSQLIEQIGLAVGGFSQRAGQATQGLFPALASSLSLRPTAPGAVLGTAIDRFLHPTEAAKKMAVALTPQEQMQKSIEQASQSLLTMDKSSASVTNAMEQLQTQTLQAAAALQQLAAQAQTQGTPSSSPFALTPVAAGGTNAANGLNLPLTVLPLTGASPALLSMSSSPSSNKNQNANAALSTRLGDLVNALQGVVKGIGGLVSIIGNPNLSVGQATGAGAAAGGQIGSALSFLPVIGPFMGMIGTAVGALVGAISGIFERAARRIAETVQNSIYQITLNFQEGSATLATTITQLEQQRTMAIAQLSGVKGGRHELDQILPQLNEQIAQLEEQQRQVLDQFAATTTGLTYSNIPQLQSYAEQIQQIVEQWKQYVDAGGNVDTANQFLQQSFANLHLAMGDQLNQDYQDAINNALQYTQLLYQQAQLQNQTYWQIQGIMNQGALVRQVTVAQQKAYQIELIQQQAAQQEQQLQEQINVSQYKLQTQQQIFDLAQTQVGLENQLAQTQIYVINEDNARISAMQQLLTQFTQLGQGYSLSQALLTTLLAGAFAGQPGATVASLFPQTVVPTQQPASTTLESLVNSYYNTAGRYGQYQAPKV